jgi:DNA-binding response OmpR family regulator
VATSTTLVTSRGAVSHELLAKKVWGQTDADPAVLVRAHIANLRAKLDHDHHRDLIRTEIGFGYRFARPDWGVARSFVRAGRS